MADEAHFHLSGCVNKQNFYYWAQENPQQLNQQKMCNCLEWSSKLRDHWSIFFLKMEKLLQSHPSDTLKCYTTSWHHNCSALELNCHLYGSNKMEPQPTLQEHPGKCCPGHVIPCGGDFSQLACSPDLTICDYFFWWHLKSQAFIGRSQYIEDLQRTIWRKIAAIPEDINQEVSNGKLVRKAEGVDYKWWTSLNNVLFKK